MISCCRQDRFWLVEDDEGRGTVAVDHDGRIVDWDGELVCCVCGEERSFDELRVPRLRLVQ